MSARGDFTRKRLEDLELTQKGKVVLHVKGEFRLVQDVSFRRLHRPPPWFGDDGLALFPEAFRRIDGEADDLARRQG